jgi:hypothetical protein
MVIGHDGGREDYPIERSSLGIKNPVTTSCWERYRYGKTFHAYLTLLPWLKNFPLAGWGKNF